MTSNYDAIKAINWSSLKHIGTSPLLYKYRLANPEPRKDAYRLGGAVHCAILEPEKFDARYAVYDGPRAGEGSRTERKAWRATLPAGVEELSPDELMNAREMAKAVRSHRIARDLLRGGRREEVVTWTDPLTGLACKGRMDYLRPDFLLDLKGTRHPSPSKFPRDAYVYGYLAQCAWYHDGAIAARLIDGKQRPYIIAVENEPPYDVACYQLDETALNVGRSICQRLANRLVQCIEADYWPGCAPDLQTLSVSQWDLNRTLAAEQEEVANV